MNISRGQPDVLLVLVPVLVSVVLYIRESKSFSWYLNLTPEDKVPSKRVSVKARLD